MPLNLPTLFARWPPKKEEMAAGMRIVETMRPCTVEERVPNVDANCDIVVRGPMVPVSSLGMVSGEGRGRKKLKLTRTMHRQKR
jgi:hypothetical protein